MGFKDGDRVVKTTANMEVLCDNWFSYKLGDTHFAIWLFKDGEGGYYGYEVSGEIFENAHLKRCYRRVTDRHVAHQMEERESLKLNRRLNNVC